MNRTKYDGHLTDSLIQAVIHAEIRQWAREVGDMTKSVTIAPSCGPKDAGDELGVTGRATGLPDGLVAGIAPLVVGDIGPRPNLVVGNLGGLGHEDDDRHDY